MSLVRPHPIASREDIEATIASLLDAWAERRCYGAMGPMLRYPSLGLGLTDDWEGVRQAFREVIASAGSALTSEEREAIDESIAAIDTALRHVTFSDAD